MTRQKAAEICQSIKFILDKADYSEEVEEALCMAIKALEQEQKWIPVTERLPDDGKWAIWCSNDGVVEIARFKEDCYNHFYPSGTSFGLEDAVAWMPLPEPYEEGAEQ